jgi:hypothetical protein
VRSLNTRNPVSTPWVTSPRALSKCHIHGVGVAAEVAASLEKADVRVAAQRMGSGQTRDARPDDGDFHAEHPFAGGVIRRVQRRFAQAEAG